MSAIVKFKVWLAWSETCPAKRKTPVHDFCLYTGQPCHFQGCPFRMGFEEKLETIEAHAEKTGEQLSSSFQVEKQ